MSFRISPSLPGVNPYLGQLRKKRVERKKGAVSPLNNKDKESEQKKRKNRK